ncbi:hypothetical protein PCPL58_3271 [Pseudomonas cerasi]|uniref:Uncharacterized protein n=2 Tax=Pseudomonas cerasi TaxID=1583341 RepID=A0A193SU64_9PSED|nr:hypothetical protein PCPL58_3271 [Pseudomonas cerasi]SOS21448.1 hypothetical protein PL963_03353 [Pseudomonas cerasi]
MSGVWDARPALRRGQHPTADDLIRMRLGYPGYEGRLNSMRQLAPARYAAVMSGAKTFDDPNWSCAECSGCERHTRNLTCRACNGARVLQVFKELPDGGTVYAATDDQASENWQQRHQRTQRLLDQRTILDRLGPVVVGRYSLEGGRVIRAGSVALDTEPLMLAVDALLSGDPAQTRAAIEPLIEQDRELALCVRTIAQALAAPKPKRT